MSKHKNFLLQALDAVMAGRQRAAQRYIERFERDYGQMNGKLTKR